MLPASTQINRIRSAIAAGLRVCWRPEPQTLVQWADEHFYLSSESSYIEGRWQTLPFQVAMMNAIGHPDIEQINIIKSARVGYSQILRAAVGYFTAHKSRNQLLFQPTDAAASGFMKAHIEPMIRDVPAVKDLAPWLGKKHRDNTLDTKRFDNGKQLWVLGGTAAKNYREKSVDCVYYDELAAFDDDIEKEGSPTFLGDKRLEGSAFPKSVRGSTPKIEPDEEGRGCQITKAAREAECFFRFHLPCPHCDQEQVLKWGGEDCDFGIKWTGDDPSTAAYLCEHCGALIPNNALTEMQERGTWRCEKTGTYTSDGMEYFTADGKLRDAPESVAFHIWTAYSPFTTWARIVRDFLKCKGDRSKLKTFVNTTLGETWQEDQGEKLDNELLYARREHYAAEIPVDDCILTAAVDTQDDRFEIEVVAWCEGQESWRISYERIYGDMSRSEIWRELHRRLSREFTTLSGRKVRVEMALIDSGGHYTSEVYAFSKKHGVTKYTPTKGRNTYGDKLATWPTDKNKDGVYLVMIGTDAAKNRVAERLRLSDFGEGYMHFPISPQFDENYFRKMCAERLVWTVSRGKRVLVWKSGGRRNEPFDLASLNCAAIELLLNHRAGFSLPPKSSTGMQIKYESTPESSTKARTVRSRGVRL